MIERNYYGAPINVHCDSCSKAVEMGTRNFAQALTIIKDAGWRVRRIDNGWFHFCRDCEVPA